MKSTLLWYQLGPVRTALPDRVTSGFMVWYSSCHDNAYGMCFTDVCHRVTPQHLTCHVMCLWRGEPRHTCTPWSSPGGDPPTPPFSLGYHNTLENLVPGVPHVVCQGVTPQHHVLLWFCSLTEKHWYTSLAEKCWYVSLEGNYRHILNSMSPAFDRTPQHHLFSGWVFYGVTTMVYSPWLLSW